MQAFVHNIIAKHKITFISFKNVLISKTLVIYGNEILIVLILKE